MINRAYNKSSCIQKLISFLAMSSMVLSFNVCAFTLNIDVKGTEVSLPNAIGYGANSYVLSGWQSVSDIRTTNHWQPGIFTTTDATLDVSNSEGVSFSVPIAVTGIQYNLAGNSVEESSVNLSGSQTCLTSNLSGNVYTLEGAVADGAAGVQVNCFGSDSITSTDYIKPFHFTRPIFSLNTEQLLETLGEQSIIQRTVLTGQITLSAKYYYRNTSGVLTYRNLPTQSFAVQIDYEPANLVKITAETMKEIIPTYDTDLHTASGTVDFNIKAEGIFPSGLRMVLIDKDNFQMEKIIDDDETIAASLNTRAVDVSEDIIPYSITCATCTPQKIVENGLLQLDAKTEVLVNEDSFSQQIDFNLTVSYSDIDAASVTTGTYQDTFTIMFEENL